MAPTIVLRDRLLAEFKEAEIHLQLAAKLAQDDVLLKYLLESVWEKINSLMPAKLFAELSDISHL